MGNDVRVAAVILLRKTSVVRDVLPKNVVHSSCTVYCKGR